MAVVLAGIDEAGYGPLLGPLTVAMAAFHVAGWSPGEPAPDLWNLLDRAICREPGDRRGRMPIADSKRLKLPNDSAKRHPLTHLERGVLAFLRAAGTEVATDSDLLAALGAAHTGRPWYCGDPVPLPQSGSEGQTAIDAGVLGSAMSSVGVRLMALRCIVIDEAMFNDIVSRTGTKGEATLHAIGRHLRWIRETLSPQAGGDPVRIVCDRLGGRTTYADLLAREIPGESIVPTEQGPRVSRYEVGSQWAVLFQPEAETAHLPVALASMTAKLVRELAMARFNRYWRARKPDLRPTAGYRADAARWLRDAAPVLSPEDRRVMVRMA